MKTRNQNNIIFLSEDNDDNDDLLFSHPFHRHEALLTPTGLSCVSDYGGETLCFGGSCDGLVLVYDSYYDLDYTFLVLNPTTNEFVKLPQSGDSKIIDRVYRDNDTLESEFLESVCIVGFGYDSLTNDYKVVSFTNFDYGYRISNPKECMSVQVYSLKTNTWRRKDNPTYYNLYWKDVGVFVNGFIHWIARRGYPGVLVILAFNLVDEKFSEVSSPNLSDDSRLFVLDEKLAIFEDGQVWLMNKNRKGESWTKIILHGLDEIQMDKPMVFEDNGNILVADNDRMLMYDVEKGTFSKTAYVWNPKNFKVTGTWVESLVSPKFNKNKKKSTKQ